MGLGAVSPKEGLWDKPPEDELVKRASLEDRVRDLEKALHGITVATFSIFGSTGGGTFEPTHRYYVEHAYEITDARVSVGVASASDITVGIFLNGSTILASSLVIAAGDNTAKGTLAVTEAQEGDYLTVSVISSDGDESDYTFQIRMRRLE